MSLDEELATWVSARPWWQQQAIARLAEGKAIWPSEYDAIAQMVLDRPLAEPQGDVLGGAFQPATPHDIPMRLLAVRDLANVNALVTDQPLTFASTGVTVVYGDNGSGKSGYARLIKQMVRARHQEDILPDIFTKSDGTPQAVLEYAIGDEQQEKLWYGQVTEPLTQVSFYDEKCGDCYVTMEAEVTYRPAVLQLLDSLIVACDGVRKVLDSWLQDNAGLKIALPSLPDETSAAVFLKSLSETTTDEELVTACSLSEHAEAKIEWLTGEEARLRSSDPAQEKARLMRTAESLDAVAVEMLRLEGALGESAEADLRAACDEALQLRVAADLVSSASFDDEPVSGVGSETWRALWEAARRFSEAEVYPDHTFPVIDDEALCPLCHQHLLNGSNHRLTRFHDFMTNDTSRRAQRAEQRREKAGSVICNTPIFAPELAVHLDALGNVLKELTEQIKAALNAFDARKTALSTLAEGCPTVLPESPASSLSQTLKVRASEFRQQADAIDTVQFSDMLARIVHERQELESTQTLACNKKAIAKELDRLRERALLQIARKQTETASITKRSSELTRKHVTESVQNRFSGESELLGVERMTLQDAGGRKGKLLHRPAFREAEVAADLPRVLSEGEQTALGLAGFFTEAYFDETKSALVLDDPITSLDHLRRNKVAKRLVELARDRQIIVFTHDVALASVLRRLSDQFDVAYTERSIERRLSDNAPGSCRNTHPWNVKNAKERLGSLRDDLARMKREKINWSRDTYDKEAGAWAGSLSETWERIISMEVANNVVDRGSLEVHVTMMKLVARITEDDNKELQESYKRCSQWATRHDKDQLLNYDAPTIEDLEAELDLVKAWFGRVKTYKN